MHIYISKNHPVRDEPSSLGLEGIEWAWSRVGPALHIYYTKHRAVHLFRNGSIHLTNRDEGRVVWPRSERGVYS